MFPQERSEADRRGHPGVVEHFRELLRGEWLRPRLVSAAGPSEDRPTDRRTSAAVPSTRQRVNGGRARHDHGDGLVIVAAAA